MFLEIIEDNTLTVTSSNELVDQNEYQNWMLLIELFLITKRVKNYKFE